VEQAPRPEVNSGQYCFCCHKDDNYDGILCPVGEWPVELAACIVPGA